METKDTLSSCSYSDEQDMQQMLKRAKILKGSCLNGLSALKSNFTRKLEQGITKSEFERAFSHIFGEDVDTFTRTSVLIKPSSLDVQEVKALDAISEDKAKKSCMVSFQKLHSHLKHLSHDNLKGTRTESGFKRAFATLFGQDIETFTGTMFLYVDQLEKQLDKEEFQEIRSMAAFKYWRIVSDKSIDERAKHKQEYNNWVNERQMQTTEDKVDSSKALDASLVIQNSRQQHTKQPEFNNEGEVDQNAEQCHDTCPLPAKLTDNQTTELSNQSLESENILKSNEAKVKHDIDVIETINIELEHKVAKLLKENETLKRHYKELSDSIKTTRAKTIEHTTSLIAQNAEFKAQLQEKGFAIAALKMRKPVLQPHRNQSVVRQPTAFKSERPRISKPRFASQVDVNNDLSKPVTTHYLPKEREVASAKPHHVIASSNSRNSSKNMPRFSSNDMVHNHYLEEAKKKTQESGRNSRPSVMPSAKSQSTANGSKPKPRSNTQTSRNWPASKNSFVTTKTVPIAEHSRNSRNFSDSKHFVCLTCQKCVFNASHDS
ncbi:hypothetical protein Tco_1111950 [Tanacetum coccineum]|uniref:Uncharacterized protein n=1 Tax=Tanacetum coccineum TaxID=301880 RepID=A0ABQ5IN78_9ASTR